MTAKTLTRPGMVGLMKRMSVAPPNQHLNSAWLVNQAGLVSRSYSIRACSGHQHRPSIRSLYGTSAFTSVRSFSLWPSAENQTGADIKNAVVQPSPDALASRTEQLGDIANANNAKPDLSAFETSTGPAIHDMGSNIADAAEHVQTLADLGRLSSWPNVRFAQWIFDGTVELTGLPWWATIALVTITIRILVLPLVFRGQSNAIRLQNIQPRIQAYMQDIQHAKATGNKVLLSESAIAVQKLMKDNNCSPFRSLLTPVILVPIFGSFFFALRGLAHAGITSMQTGGLSWFTDLTIPDPYFILPTASILMSLAVIETGAEMGASQQVKTQQQKNIRNGLRIITVASLYIFIDFPAAVFCYMAVNNTFSLLQLVTLQLPAVRKALNLPEKIEHAPQVASRGKPLGFWDGIKAGNASQTSANVVSRNRVPFALNKSRDKIEEDREAALRGIVQQQGQSLQNIAGGHLAEHPVVNATSSINSTADTQSVSSERDQVSSVPEDAPYGEEDDRQARIREKQRRVQAARQKRVKK